MLTIEEFAKLSFKTDIKEGRYDFDDPNKYKTFSFLPENLKNAYLSEAEYYVNKVNQEDWPEDILKEIK